MTDSRPRWGVVYDDLRERIDQGDLAPGSTVPSELRLVEQYGFSRNTVRTALSRLEREGLITEGAGSLGRTVRTRRTVVHRPQQEREPRRSATMDRFMAALSEEGRSPTQSIEVVIENAHGIVAERFKVPLGTPIVARRRVRSVDGEPFSISDTYYLHTLAKDTAIMEPTDIPEGSNAIMRAILGDEVRAIDEFYIRMPTPEESRRLKLGGGTPVAEQYTTGYTKDDKVIRVEHFIIPGDRHVILYERVHPKVKQ